MKIKKWKISKSMPLKVIGAIFLIWIICSGVFTATLTTIRWISSSPAKVDLRCGPHNVLGTIWADRVGLKIEGLTSFPQMLPLQGVFTDEPAAKYAPKLISNPEFAMTITSYVGLLADGRKIEFMVYSKDGKSKSHELEIGDDKWQCR